MKIDRIEMGPRISAVVRYNGMAFVSGQIPAKSIGEDIRVQTQEVLARVESLLSTAGSDKTKLLSASIWLADIADFGPMNQIWEQWIDADHKPARATVGAALSSPGFAVEISVIAAV
jgi:enamine deaminase RidA (YjgF/YER057c/UK114 family)